MLAAGIAEGLTNASNCEIVVIPQKIPAVFVDSPPDCSPKSTYGEWKCPNEQSC